MFESDDEFLFPEEGVLRLHHLLDALAGVAELLEVVSNDNGVEITAVVSALPPNSLWMEQPWIIQQPWLRHVLWSCGASRRVCVRLFRPRDISPREIRLLDSVGHPNPELRRDFWNARNSVCGEALCDQNIARVYCLSLRVALCSWASEFPRCERTLRTERVVVHYRPSPPKPESLYCVFPGTVSSITLSSGHAGCAGCANSAGHLDNVFAQLRERYVDPRRLEDPLHLGHPRRFCFAHQSSDHVSCQDSEQKR
jgi:hypothetical protein